MGEKHELAGKTVVLNSKSPELNGKEYKVEDFWTNVAEFSWMKGWGNPACLAYGVRVVTVELPLDDNVVYGKIGCLGYLVHVSELGGILHG